jgi:periplasmic divalent cation tolerance protein
MIQTTCATNEEAKNIAKLVIEKKLAACVQIMPIESVYVWDNAVCEDLEYLLIIKTKKGNYKKIEREIKENHSYDLPEIIGTKIVSLSKEYKKFIKESTDE